MADFEKAFEVTMRREGGYQLTDIPGDNGGQTYAGIARRPNPDWAGWAYIDRGETPPTAMVRDFYRAKFWRMIGGDQILDDYIAESIYDFGVNAGHKTSVKLAQIVAGVAPDGVVGEKTLAAINGADPKLFRAYFALAKLKRYAEICNRNRSQSKFLLGWINRILEAL